MKNKLYLLMVVILCVTAFGWTPQKVAAQRDSPPQNEKVEYVPGEMIVVFRKGFTATQAADVSRSIASSISGRVLQVRDNAALFEVDESIDVPSFTANFSQNIQALNADAEKDVNFVAYAQPNYIYDVPEPQPPSPPPPPVDPTDPLPNNDEETADHADVTKRKSTPTLPTYPEDPYLYNQWGWWNTDSDVVWQDKSGSPLICLLDTGVDAAHPDLAGKIVNGKDIVNDDNIPDDDHGHGTHVAGIMVAKSNNKIGISGTSNSKVLAIKVLDSRGRGDSWDIGYGIILCANNSAVKIINMSFGSYAVDSFMYSTLEWAIYYQGKLGVAAAGNGSTSDLTFPAAWAGNFVCSDGFPYNPPSNCGPGSGDPYPNYISDGMISVGASRSYWSSSFDGYSGGSLDGYLWVDTNENNVQEGGELYSMSSCATSFSNFGRWVSIVAPGEEITSTVPVSYPFYEQYTYGADSDGDGYDTWSGTSMSAPLVSGAAARVWSIGSKLFGTAPTNKLVKNRLVSTGTPVVTAMDAATNPINWGYYSIYYDYPNPWPTFQGEAPFCWPDGTFGTRYNMTGTRMLSVADAMNRSTLYVYIFNATNGLPLKGAKVTAVKGTSVKSQALVNSNTSPVAVLPNLPREDAYKINVNKKGFTNGNVTISTVYIPSSYAYLTNTSLTVSIPPMGKITGVIDWIPFDQNKKDLDFYLWIPQYSPQKAGYPSGAVGYPGISLNTYTLGTGRLTNWPYARWNYDGGGYYSWMGSESLTIKPRPGYPTWPYYNRTQYDAYDFIVHDWQAGALNANDVFFRLWIGGKIKKTVQKSVDCDTDGPDNIAGNADDQRWWEPGYFWKGTFYVWNVCGKGATYNNGGIWPYSVPRSSDLPAKRDFGTE